MNKRNAQLHLLRILKERTDQLKDVDANSCTSSEQDRREHMFASRIQSPKYDDFTFEGVGLQGNHISSTP